MEALIANDYTNKLIPIMFRELKSHNENMEKIVLKVIKQCVSTKGVEFVPELLQNFWDMGMNLDKRNYKRFVETIIEMTNKVGVDNFGKRKIENLTNSGESRRQLAMEAIEKVVSYLKLCDMDVEVLIDGILSDDVMVLEGFGTVVTSLGMRVKPHFPQICDTLSERLHN
jgi:splicing factor 3B subunit 1